MADTPGRILNVDLDGKMRESYLEYSMSVIVSRALPDVRDGLKPVHRRVLVAMNDLDLQPGKPYRKSAKITGDTTGNYHPHGTIAVYDTMVRMAQDFSLRYPLVDGQGNFGSVDGDAAAAERYTEARLTRIATELMRDLEKETVVFVPNYDGSRQMPGVLPSAVPNLLINGATGIAVGMATNIPPHNIGEICDGLVALLDDPDLPPVALLAHVQGPDFPTGGIIQGRQGIHDYITTGRGRLVVRARTEIELDAKGRATILVTELPYQVNKAALIERMADLVRDGHLEGISDLRDESDRDGMRIVILLKRDAFPQVVLNKLFAHTQLQQTFGVNTLALVDNRPRVLNLKEAMQEYLRFREEVVVRRTRYDLRKAEERAHILEGYRIAIDNIDAIVALIRASESPAAAKEQLMARFAPQRDPGPGHPRPAPGPPDRPRAAEDRTGVPRADPVDRRTEGDPGQPRPRAADHPRRAAGDPRDLRRRAAHRDRGRRGRHRAGGPDRRRGRHRHDHARRLRQAHPDGGLPPAAARRAGRDRHQHQGRGLRGALLRRLDPPVSARPVGEGAVLLAEGARNPERGAHRQGQAARQPDPDRARATRSTRSCRCAHSVPTTT